MYLVREEPLRMLPGRFNLVPTQSRTLLVYKIVTLEKEITDKGLFC